jgi:hypothetical protein
MKVEIMREAGWAQRPWISPVQGDSRMSGRLQQGLETPFGIQRHQVITAAHMGGPNENLGHCAATCGLHHVIALHRIGVDANFFDLLNTFGLEDLLGTRAIRANGCGVHLDGLHGETLGNGSFKGGGNQAFSVGMLAATQARRPPDKDWTFS